MALAASASPVSAAPAWKFNGTELTGSETIAGDAVLSNFTSAALTVTCKKMHYTMTIKNVSGTGKGEVTAVTFTNCVNNLEGCTIEPIGAEKLPWAVNLKTIATNRYVLFEGVKIAMFFNGPLCVLGETLVTITGSAGGLYDNPTETFAFSSPSFSSTGTGLKMLGQATQWNGAFTTEATGGHSGQALTIS